MIDAEGCGKKWSMAFLRTRPCVALLIVLFSAATSFAAAAPKPEKIPVAFGAWTGPAAATFKSALRHGLTKDCSAVSAKKARVLIEGVVAEQGKGVVVHVTVKSVKTGEIVETREFAFARPKPSQGQVNKMARAVVEIARRSPSE